MTVSSLTPVNNYMGNGSVTIFDFDFLIENQEELIVTYTDKKGFSKTLEFGIDYSINEIGNENGSYITFPLQNSTLSVLQQDEVLSLSLNLPIKQESKFSNSSYLNLSVLEKTFDYIIRILQILDRKIERSIKVQEGSDVTPDALMKELKDAENNTSLFSKTCEEFAKQSQTHRDEALEQANRAQQSATTAFDAKEEIVQGNMFKYQLFDVVSKDSVLSFSEKQGFELLGSYVYKNALAGTRYGYPDFYNKCIEEMQESTLKEVTLGDTTISMYVNLNGHQFYDIQDKDVVDTFYATYGSAWFYGVDTLNECIFLPRYDYVSLNSKDRIPVVGNGMTLGLKAKETAYGLGNWTPSENATYTGYTGLYGKPRGTSVTGSKMSSAVSLGITEEADKSGIEADVSTFGSKKYYYMVVGNVKTTEGYSEVVAQGKEILAQVNAGLISKTDKIEVDGQWNVVSDYPYIFTATAVGDYTVDISDYLPQDDYVYEVMLRCYGYNSAATDKRIAFGTDLFPIIDASNAVVAFILDSDRVKLLQNTVSFLTFNRSVSVKITGGALNESSIRLIAYRRIGTNQ